MNIGKARALFEQVASREFHESTVGEYLEAVKIVLDMETHNSISKKMIISVCKWLVEIAEQPTIQPEQHEGYWIPHEGIDGDIQYECSKCGVLWEFNDGTPEDNEAYFCPKCGKKLITK